MVKIFENGLEEGNFSIWDAGLVNVTGTSMVDALHSHSGVYAGHFTTTPTLAQATAMARKNIAPQDEIYVRAYVYMNQGPAQMIQYDRAYAILLLGADGSNSALVGLRMDVAGQLRWVLWFRTGSPNPKDGTHVLGPSLVTALSPHWVCVELHYSKSQNKYEVYIDGVLEIVQTVASASMFPAITQVWVGVYKSGTVGQPYDPTHGLTYEFWIDDVIAATSYIGPIVVPTNPKITVNSSPELNVPVYIDNQLAGNTPMTVELQSGTHTVRVDEGVQR